jgi:integrase
MVVANPDGTRPISRTAYAKKLDEWIELCGIRTESGAPAHVTPHQWRHTYATRLINSGVPQHVVREAPRPRLGHHDRALRAAVVGDRP